MEEKMELTRNRILKLKKWNKLFAACAVCMFVLISGGVQGMCADVQAETEPHRTEIGRHGTAGGPGMVVRVMINRSIHGYAIRNPEKRKNVVSRSVAGNFHSLSAVQREAQWESLPEGGSIKGLRNADGDPGWSCVTHMLYPVDEEGQ